MFKQRNEMKYSVEIPLPSAFRRGGEKEIAKAAAQINKPMLKP